jgi:hypothetical protein
MNRLMAVFALVMLAAGIAFVDRNPIPLEVSPTLRGPVPSGWKSHAHQNEATSDEHENTKKPEISAPVGIGGVVAAAKEHRDISAQPENEGEWYTRPDWWIAICTGLLVAATAGLWTATWLLYRKTSEAVADGEKALKSASEALAAANRHADESAALVQVTKDTAMRQLRAYVAITNGNGRPRNIGEQLVVDATVVLKNSGQTPGYQFTTWIESDLREAKKDFQWGEIRPLDSRPNKSIIGSGEIVDLGKSTLIDAGDVAALEANEKTVYVWGGADYVDAFGNPRFFRFKITISGPRGPNGYWPIRPHKDGYEAN